VAPAGKTVKKAKQSPVTDNRLASTSYDHDVAAGSENDEDADYDERRDNRDELEESVRNGAVTNRKRTGITVSQKCTGWCEKPYHSQL